jgi:hypothetical protein
VPDLLGGGVGRVAVEDESLPVEVQDLRAVVLVGRPAAVAEVLPDQCRRVVGLATGVGVVADPPPPVGIVPGGRGVDVVHERDAEVGAGGVHAGIGVDAQVLDLGPDPAPHVRELEDEAAVLPVERPHPGEVVVRRADLAAVGEVEPACLEDGLHEGDVPGEALACTLLEVDADQLPGSDRSIAGSELVRHPLRTTAAGELVAGGRGDVGVPPGQEFALREDGTAHDRGAAARGSAAGSDGGEGGQGEDHDEEEDAGPAAHGRSPSVVWFVWAMRLVFAGYGHAEALSPRGIGPNLAELEEVV